MREPSRTNKQKLFKEIRILFKKLNKYDHQDKKNRLVTEDLIARIRVLVDEWKKEEE